MLNIVLITQLAFVTLIEAKDLTANHNSDAKDVMDKSVDKLIDKLVDKLVNKALPLSQANVDKTMLATPGKLAMPSPMSLRPLPSFVSANRLRGKLNIGRHTKVAAAKEDLRKAMGLKKEDEIEYGENWYSATRKAIKETSSNSKYMDRWRKANYEANNGMDRKDLYTDAWAGDEYQGSKFNILTLLGGLFVLVPVLGIAFALSTKGVLWG